MRLLLVMNFTMILASAFAQENVLLTFQCPNCYKDSIDEKKILSRSENGVLYSSVYVADSYTEPSAIITTSRISCFDCPMGDLYKMAFFDKMKGSDNDYSSFGQSNRMLWDVQDTALLRFREFVLPHFDNMSDSQSLALAFDRNEYIDKNTFCYSINVQGKNNFGKTNEMMLNDLNNFFERKYGMVGEMKTQSIKCKALVSISPSEKFKGKDGLTAIIAYQRESLNVKNMAVANFLSLLSDTYFPNSHEPMINETRYSGNIDIVLTGNLSDLEVVNSQLERYDLKLVEKEKEIKMIIIKQVDKK